MASQEFEANLVAILPKMRVWAAGLTRNRSEVDDLVQETALKVLAACHQFLSGTNFMAWVRRIMVNQFISGIRKQRLFTDMVPEQPVSATHLDQIELRELARAMDSLPRAQRIALSAIALAEKSYDELAVETGCPTGTLKSRVHRARAQLRLCPSPGEGQELRSLRQLPRSMHAGPSGTYAAPRPAAKLQRDNRGESVLVGSPGPR